MSSQDSQDSGTTRREDRLPREVVWVDDQARLAYRDYPQFEKWKRQIVEEHSSVCIDIPEGSQGWQRFRDMIRAVRNTQIQDMLDQPDEYYDFKELIRERAGQHSMRYNRETIRLVMRFYDNPDGASVVEILHFGYRYGKKSRD